MSRISLDEKMMRQALLQAKQAQNKNEVPVGAVIVDERGEIIAFAHNEQEQRHDATAHAEILVMRRAAAKLQRWRLTDLTLYVTLEPCPMCAGAIFLSRIRRVVYGALDTRMGAMESLFAIPTHPALNHRIEVRAGVLEDECKMLLHEFFTAKRKKGR